MQRLVSILASFALLGSAACATPRYDPARPWVVYGKCGVPYTPEEDRAGVEHYCPDPAG